MSNELIVFDSHPVQYRVPVWRKIASQNPGSVHVIYGSDCSVRGHADTEFGVTISWDEPMLEGYDHTVLNCEKGVPLSGWQSLTGSGVGKILDKLKPKVVLLTGLNYLYDLTAYVEARRRGIPLWLRCETQDEAIHRSKGKGIIRSLLYRIIYQGFDRVFYIGQLNRNHYLRHGVPESKLKPARYGTVDRFIDLKEVEKKEQWKLERRKAGISETDFVIGFSGKLIPKKNPEILFRMLDALPDKLRARTCLYFLGSGELEQSLRNEADKALQKFGVRSIFAGFVNQSKLASHYLIMDVMVLPSRRMGETWGLVANEAMQAGCGVIVSDAVGCHADFESWERFRIFPGEDAKVLANHIVDLAKLPRKFDWAARKLQPYSITAIAEAITEEMKTI